MTSQKRNRYHQDNSNSRFRDLPPRFKRQKSQTSPTPPNAESHPQQTGNKNTRTEIPVTAQALQPSQSPSLTQTQFQSHHHPLNSNLSVASASMMNQTRITAPVLTPVDNTALYTMRSIPSPVSFGIPIGTHYGYAATPPLSPWASGGVVNSGPSPKHTSDFGNSPWSPASADQFKSHSPGLQSASGYYGNPRQIKSASHPVSTATCDTLKDASQIPSTSRAQLDSGCTDKKPIDYSDPDVRTIEMLKELERVADEKENDEDFGADRKSLVSHHLRMLMCALDRYTESIDDEDTDIPTSSRDDEVASATSSPAPTPGPAISPSPSTAQWPQKNGMTNVCPNSYIAPSPNSSCSPKPDAFKSENVSQIYESSLSYSGPVQSQAQLHIINAPPQAFTFPPPGIPPQVQPKMEEPTWNMWSSPSFSMFGNSSQSLFGEAFRKSSLE